MAIADVDKNIHKFFENVERRVLTTMQYVGEDFQENGRSTNTYTDRTANLRNSIGYGVKADGQIMSMSAGKGEGGEKSEVIIRREGNKDHALVLTAGMEYAADVESRGYDVVSNSVNIAKDDYKKKLNQALKRLVR